MIFQAKTLLDTSLDVKTGSTEIRGGRGAQLFYIYYHTAAMTLQLTDVQFNLAFLGQTVGSDIVTGNDVYTSENVTLGSGGTGTVSGTPLALPNSGAIYGWVNLVGGTTQRVTFTGSNFTCSGTAGQVVCVRYWANNAASRSITIPANIIPNVLRLNLEAQLNTGDEVGTNQIGIVQIQVPEAQLSGAFQIQMKADKHSVRTYSNIWVDYIN